jgi:hypothetical protein
MTSRRAANVSAQPVELIWQIWVPGLVLAVILITATRTDPDLWGHVRFGLDWLRTRALPPIDPYSFTQDKPWVNHEWLSETLMGGAFALAATAGLVLLKAGVVAATACIVWHRLAGCSPLVRTAFTTIAVVGALPLTTTVRPQIWSLLGLALLVLILNDREPSWKRMLGSAALFCVWANLHGGWITGGGALGLHAVIRSVRAPAQATRWLALGWASLGATLLNPYGTGLWQFLAATVRSTRPDISEWAPFSLHEPPIMWVSVIAPLALVALLLRSRTNRPTLETCAVIALLVAAGIRVSRVAPLVCPACIALLGPSIRKAWGDLARLSAPTPAAATILFLPSVFALATAPGPIHRALSCLPIEADWAPDRTAAAQLAGRDGRLWTTFDWGEYAIWQFGPALRVSIDGRRETVYSESVIAWHRSVERGDDAAIARLIRLGPEYVWLRSNLLSTRRALVNGGYRVDVDTGTSFIAVRADVPALSASASPLPACFP